MSGRQLSDRLSKNPNAVASYETGKSTPPLEVIYQLAKIFQVSPAALISEDLTDPETYPKALLKMMERVGKIAAREMYVICEENNQREEEAEEQLLTRKQAADFLGINVATLDRWSRVGIVPRYLLGGYQPRWKLSELKGMLKPDNTDETK